MDKVRFEASGPLGILTLAKEHRDAVRKESEDQLRMMIDTIEGDITISESPSVV